MADAIDAADSLTGNLSKTGAESAQPLKEMAAATTAGAKTGKRVKQMAAAARIRASSGADSAREVLTAARSETGRQAKKLASAKDAATTAGAKTEKRVKQMAAAARIRASSGADSAREVLTAARTESGRQVQKLASARDAVTTGGARTGNQVKKLAAATRTRASSAGDYVAGKASVLSGEVSARASKLSRQTAELPASLAGFVFTECPVPTTLLPTGPGAGDFVCTFDFEQVVNQLMGGRLVRPRIVAWAGKKSISRTRLAHLLHTEFAKQFRAQRKAIHRRTDPELSKEIRHLRGRAEASRESNMATAQSVVVGFVALLLVFNPAFDVILLAFSLLGGGALVQSVGRIVSTSVDLSQAERGLKSKRKQLEKELHLSQKRFKSAVSRIEVHVHPVLHDIVSGMSEFDDLVPPPKPGANRGLEPPSVEAQLSTTWYRNQVPVHFHPFIDVHCPPRPTEEEAPRRRGGLFGWLR